MRYFTKKEKEKAKDEQEEEGINLTFDLLRVMPEPQSKVVNHKTDRLTDLLIGLFIFGIAFWFRWYVRTLYLATYGNGAFDIKIAASDPLGFGAFLGKKTGETAFTEGYYDYYTYYIPYVREYANGWNPYTGSKVPDDPLNGYVYGPYYILSIAFGKIYLGMDVRESIDFSNILFDSLTYVMVYVLGKRVTGNIVAGAIALLASFSPISLFYIAYMGLNAPIMNFSFLVFIYFYLERRDSLAMFFLAFSILTKQFPLFMAMPVGYWMVRRHGIAKGVSIYLKGVLFVFLLSVPYILISTNEYIIRFFLPGGGKGAIYCPQGSEATNLFHALIPREACDPNNLGPNGSLDTSLLPNGYLLWFDLVNNHILFAFSLIVIAWAGFTGYDYLEENPKLYYVFIGAYYFMAHATIARGIYKYYSTFLVPLLVLALIPGSTTKSLHIRLGAQLNRLWSRWIDPYVRQGEVSIFYWSVFLALMIASGGVFYLLSAAISMFSWYNNSYRLWMVIFSILAIVFIYKPGPQFVEKGRTYSTLNSVSRKQLGIIAVVGIFSYYLYFIADIYFTQFDLLLQNALVMGIILLVFLVMPFLEQQLVKGTSKVFDMYTVDYTQLLIDVVLFIIAYIVIAGFHIKLMTIYRYYTSLIVFLYGVLLMGLLGNQVWSSFVKVPIRWVQSYFRLRYYVNEPIVQK